MQLSERVRNLNNNKTIKIKKVILLDQGNYTCIAENTLGKLNLTLELNVRQGRHDNVQKTELSVKQTPKTVNGEEQVQNSEYSSLQANLM